MDSIVLFFVLYGLYPICAKAGKTVADNKETIAKEGWSFFKGLWK
jgi:hypothetical protein